MRYRYRGCERVQLLLEIGTTDAVQVRAVEVGVKSSYHGTVCFFDCKQRKRRCERGVHVDDVILTTMQRPPKLFAHRHAECYSCLRSVEVNRLAMANPHHVRLILGTLEARGDDVNLMSPAASLSGEEMDVLADATEMRIVVLGNERDSQRPRELRSR